MAESKIKRVPEEALAELEKMLKTLERPWQLVPLTPLERLTYSAAWIHGWRTRDEQEQECPPTPPSDQTSPTA